MWYFNYGIKLNNLRPRWWKLKTKLKSQLCFIALHAIYFPLKVRWRDENMFCAKLKVLRCVRMCVFFFFHSVMTYLNAFWMCIVKVATHIINFDICRVKFDGSNEMNWRELDLFLFKLFSVVSFCKSNFFFAFSLSRPFKCQNDFFHFLFAKRKKQMIEFSSSRFILESNNQPDANFCWNAQTHSDIILTHKNIREQHLKTKTKTKFHANSMVDTTRNLENFFWVYALFYLLFCMNVFYSFFF